MHVTARNVVIKSKCQGRGTALSWFGHLNKVNVTVTVTVAHTHYRDRDRDRGAHTFTVTV